MGKSLWVKVSKFFFNRNMRWNFLEVSFQPQCTDSMVYSCSVCLFISNVHVGHQPIIQFTMKSIFTNTLSLLKSLILNPVAKTCNVQSVPI